MTEQEYLARKAYYDQQYQEMDAALDRLGFGEYLDLNWSSGYRRLFVGDNVYEVLQNSMEADYFGDYPDGQFLGVIRRNRLDDKWLETVEDLEAWVKGGNWSYKINWSDTIDIG